MPTDPQTSTSMEPLTNLTVVHIPHNDAPPCLAGTPLIDIDPDGIDIDEYDEFEKKLGRVPDLKSHEGFRWAHRSLVSKSLGFGEGGTWEAVYMIYVCLDGSAGLPHNKFLEGTYFPGHLKAYGDAFVFKREPGPYGVDEAGRARYTDMDKSFVLDARHGDQAKMILRELILCPAQWVMRRGAGDYQCRILSEDGTSTSEISITDRKCFRDK